MPNIDNREPIDAASSEYEPLLRRLQGNILKGHGRNFTANIFLQFHVRDSELRAALRLLTERFVTSAHDQLGQRNQYQMMLSQPAHLRPTDPMFGNLFLTRNAYKKLGLEAQLAEWFPDPDEGVQAKPRRSRFRTGMLEAAGELGDELTVSDAVEPLEIAYLEGTIDALLLLANDSESHVIDTAKRLMADLSRPGIATIVAFETGSVRRNHLRQGIEHFGYADGISQPLFFTSDFERARGC